ncbi:MAG: hypothetical protein IH969_03070, partial [Candidatus Krumholzibacteriota bacterium]|nr:hypothetical protein [Candidatus Krumholzibacteriota bacterium]
MGVHIERDDIDDVTVNAGAEINDIELHFDNVDVTGASGTLTFNTSVGGQCSVNFGTG